MGYNDLVGRYFRVDSGDRLVEPVGGRLVSEILSLPLTEFGSKQAGLRRSQQPQLGCPGWGL